MSQSRSPLAVLLAAASLTLVSLPAPARARDRNPGDGPLFESMEAAQSRANRGAVAGGVFSAASQDTVYFGGTFWNADSSRWEALQDSIWTFDTGVGSSIVPPGGPTDPGANPFKEPGLHQTMEGWIGFDKTYSEVTYFRRVSASQTSCVGAGAGLSGSWSFYAGVFASEAQQMCYAAGAGYGNNWHVCLARTFTWTGGDVILSYKYVNDTEPNYDFTTVRSDTSLSGGQGIMLTSYTGSLSGTAMLTLHPGVELPVNAPHDVIIKFCFDSDGAYSDEDGNYATTCGAFALDDVSLSGGITSPLEDFETGDGGWTLTPIGPGSGGDWSDLVSLGDLPPIQAPCACSLRDSVLVFIDENVNGHGSTQDNIAASPWIDLKEHGLIAPGKIIRTDVYADLPLLNYIFIQYMAQWYPEVCPLNGKLIVSPWTSNGFFYFFDGAIHCTGALNPHGEQIDFSPVISPEAEQVRIGVGVLSFCLFFSNCSGITNTTPWFDNVALGVYGTPGAPYLSASNVDLPQDSFPANGTLNKNAPGRMDSNTLKGSSTAGPNTELGDTLVVRGASGDTPAEVRVQFAVHPGPGINTGALQTWLAKNHYEETKDGLDWYSARMDTAEAGPYGTSRGIWMTAYHEEDPNFIGTDRTMDPGDPDPTFHLTHLANDVFPDNLFTPGTRVMVFYKTHYIGSPIWFVLPDTSGGNVYEMEVLPSSMEADNSHNDVLFVDRVDGVESERDLDRALAAALPGGSANFENTAWDRYDVRGPKSTAASFGRPFYTYYGASAGQALAYRIILWDSGNLFSDSFTQQDAAVLNAWLTATGTGLPSRCLYLSGDNVASGTLGVSGGPTPEALALLHQTAGVSNVCSGFRLANCPTGTVADLTPCVELDRTTGARTAPHPRGVIHAGQGNGCPNFRNFDVITPATDGSSYDPVAEERYEGDLKAAPYSSVSDLVPGPDHFKTVVDGVALRHRGDAVTCMSPGADPPAAMVERLNEVLAWFGAPDTTTTGVGPPDGPVFRTALLPVAPNPVLAGDPAHIAFTMAETGPARVVVYDLAGRRVRTVFSGQARQGDNEAVWDLRDARGLPVAAGVYLYRLEAGGTKATRKLVVAAGR